MGPPLLMGMTMDVSYIKSYALEFGWVRLHTLANGNDDGCFIRLESCIEVWLGKTLLMGVSMDVSYI